MRRHFLGAVLLIAACPKADAPPPSVEAPRIAVAPPEDPTPSEKIEAARKPGVARALAPGDTVDGIHRDEVRVVGEGRTHDEGAVVVTPQGQVVVAAVYRSPTGRSNEESIVVRVAASASAPLSNATRMTVGERAWHPALATSPTGVVWLAWCGRQGPAKRGDHRRAVYVRRVHPSVGKVIRVSPAGEKDARHCDPDLAIASDGTLQVVWEHRGIRWRAVARDGTPGEMAILSQVTMARRPSVVVEGETVHVAWDELLTSHRAGADDPDYDVMLRSRRDGTWGAVVPVDQGDGIQAAPDLALAPGGGVLVAYHTSMPHGLVKWWTLRRVRGEVVEAPTATDGAWKIEPSGEMQGAEWPAIALSPDGVVFVVTRPSQGAYLHRLTGAGFATPLDLTRRGWGARGMRASVAFATDGSLLLVRRARHDTVLERFTLAPAAASEIVFAPTRVHAKPKREAFALEPLRVAGWWRRKKDGADPQDRILLGDVHMHSAMSDGTGPPDEIYARAWERTLHFAVLTDHDYIVGSRMALSEHDEMSWVTDQFDALPDFAALHAYEWTTPLLPRGSGHQNVYFRGHAPTPVYGFEDGAPDLKALNARLREERAFTAPHHTSWTGTDWENFDPQIQRHFEIVSTHGVAEYPGNTPVPSRGEMEGMFAVDGLRNGHRFGFVGGSDAHGLLWHHGQGRRRDSWRQGLTGVVTNRWSREGIWDALWARHSFATSGGYMGLLVTVDRVTMGTEGKVGARPTVHWNVHATADLSEISVVRDGKTVHREEVAGRSHDARWVDEDVTPGAHSYYVRAIQGSGLEHSDLAWSSPAFVTVEEKK